jgi:hypothetical protein
VIYGGWEAFASFFDFWDKVSLGDFGEGDVEAGACKVGCADL